MRPRITILFLSAIFASSVMAQSTTEEDGPTTTITFDQMEHDFGNIDQGSENEFIFKFTNTGDIPLVISNAKGSCGCTVPHYPKQPIMPGESSEIHAVYKPGKQKGRQTKRITITANTEPLQTSLKITADVREVEDFEIDDSIFALNAQQQKDREAIEAIDPGCFVIFPNPTSDELQLDLKEHIGRSAEILIHDETGKHVLQKSIPSVSSESTRFDLSGFSAGIYVISIVMDGVQPMSQCFVVTDR